MSDQEGFPREQYKRTYVLLPQNHGAEWVRAILDSNEWARNRWTIGSSADDAGIGALEDKTVIAVNPDEWGDLRGFFATHYPGTVYEEVWAVTPANLTAALRGDVPGNTSLVGIHGAPTLGPPPKEDWDYWLQELRDMGIKWYKMLYTGADAAEWITLLVGAGITPILRMYAGPILPDSLPDTIMGRVPALVDLGVRYFEPHNEPNLTSEWQERLRGDVSWDNPRIIDMAVDAWARDAERVVQAGGKVAIPAMAPTDSWGNVHPQYSGVRWLERFLGAVKVRHGHLVTAKNVWLAVHAAAFDRPFDFDPFQYHNVDQMCLRSYEAAQAAFVSVFGFVPETISTEGGCYSPEHLRYLGWLPGGYTEERWAQDTVAMFRFLRQNGALKAMCPWILTDQGVSDPRWIGNGWFRGKDPRPVVTAMKQSI
jgi:hypothetical protein